MTPDALWSGRMARFYWLFSHFLVFLILLLRDSTLHQKMFITHDYLYVTVFILFFAVLIVLYFVSGGNPGYLPVNPDTNSFRIQMEEEDIHTEEEEKRESMTNKKEGEEDVELGVVLATSLNDPDSQPAPVSDEPLLHFCNKCNITQPLRAKHCVDCERCVSRYDHHCFFVGGCVGQKNHLRFYTYLGFQSWVIAWAFSVALGGYASEDTISAWFYSNGLLLVTTIVIFVWFFLPFGLFMFHTYLMLTNQTTWEVSKREKITYLHDLPEEEFPFDKGCLRNLIEFVTMHARDIAWHVPTDIRTRTRKFNIWVNEYWSCF